jgi:choline dehydrogenase-like flavoprotein
MIEAAEGVPGGTGLEADVCVVGAGPAGIALALSLCGKGLRVVLLEAGRHPHDRAAQSLYAGELTGPRVHPPLHQGRARGLGGTSARWDGRCVPFDAVDFEERAHMPHSGWPISYEGLLPYYARAHAWVEAGDCAYDAHQVFPDRTDMIHSLQSTVLRTSVLERYSCPTHFGKRYRKRLELAPDLRVLTGAHATALRAEATGASVRAVEVATLSGNRFTIRAKTVVLAAGALETARLLLSSNDVVAPGLGNQLDVVGRYYQSHLVTHAAVLELRPTATAVRYGYERAADGAYCRRRLAIDGAAQRRHGLHNTIVRLQPEGNGTAPRAAPGWPRWIEQARHQARVAAAAPMQVPAQAMRWVRHRVLAERKLPSLIAATRSNRFMVEMQSEQQPLPSSRVTLGDGVDALGQRSLQVDWRSCMADVESIQRSLQLIAREVARGGVGHLDYRPEFVEEDLALNGARAGHHIGTARMGTDPRTSVVNAECRVHTVDNLYVAGSAVFPTGSQADPTLTALALSLRLADRLVQRLQPRHAAAEELFA